MVVCGQASERKEVEVPGGKSGLCQSGVIGPRIEEMSCFWQVSWKEVRVGRISA